MNLNKIKYQPIRIDLGFIYSIALFFSFFVYGGVSNKYWFGLLIFPLMYFSIHKLNLKIKIKLRNLALTLLLGLLFLIFNNENATNPLIGDHLYHASIAYTIPLQIIKHKVQFFPEVSAGQILWLYSAGMVSFTILMTFIYGKSKQHFFSILVLLGTLILSIAFIKGIANNDPHPPLRSYVLSLLGFFGINSTVFRIQGLIPLLILTYWIIERDGIKWRTAIFLLYVYSIPVLFFNTLIVEYSIWTFAIFTIFMIEVHNIEKWSNRKIIFFAISFTLIGLIRQTAAFGLFLLVIHCIFEKNYSIIRWIIPISLPISFQILNSLTIGNPATYVPNEVFLNIPTNIGLIERLILSISFESYSQILASTGTPSLAVLFFYMVRNIFVRDIKLLTIISVYICMFWLLFHMIRPILWGVPRYQLEYISPLVAAGFYCLNSFSLLMWRVSSLFFITFNIIYILNAYYNVRNYKIDYPEYFKGETPFFSESIFNTEQAIRSSYAECRGNFNLGESPSENFPLILAGLSAREVSNSLNYSVSSNLKKQDSILEDKAVVCSLELIPGFFPGSFYNKTRNTSTLVKLK